MADPYISEFTTNWVGTSDFVEIRVDQGTDVSDLRVVFYDSAGERVDTRTLGAIDGTENGGDIYTLTGGSIADARAYALYDTGTGQVLQFVSSGQTVTAIDGPANRQTSQNVGSHTGSQSMQSDDGGQSYYTQSAPNPDQAPAPVCFARGTRLLTPGGYRAVEDLAAGDLLTTAGNGDQPILWVGSDLQRFGPGDSPHKPMQIRAGCVGPGIPMRDLVLSPQHRVYLSRRGGDGGAGGGLGLVAVKHLQPLARIRRMQGKRGASYFHVLLARHEIVSAEGVAAETLYLGPQAQRSVADRRPPVPGLDSAARVPQCRFLTGGDLRRIGHGRVRLSAFHDLAAACAARLAC